MANQKWETDEDRMIYRYQVHRNLVGWVIKKLAEAGISSFRTTGNNRNADILINHPQDAPRVKAVIATIHQLYSARRYSLTESSAINVADELFIEIKGEYIYGKEIDQIIAKGNVIGVVSTQRISQPGKCKLEQAGIAYAESVPEQAVMGPDYQEDD